MPQNLLHVVFAAILLVFFGVMLVWPIVQVVWTGFVRPHGGFTLEYVALIFRDPATVQGLLHAAEIAISVTLLTVCIALPLAVLSVRCDFAGRSLLTGLLLVPLVLPPFVGAIGMKLVLGRFGPLSQLVGAGRLGIDWMGKYRAAGVVIIEALHLYPILLLNLQAALANIDPAMEQAAANLGASRFTIFRNITLPLVRPGLFAGCTLVLIWSFTELGTPLMFGLYTVTPVQVFQQIMELSSNPMPYALVVVMLAASAALYVVGKVLLGQSPDAATSKAAVSVAVRRLSGWKAAIAIAAFAIVIFLAVVPHLSVILTSFSATGAWYKSLLPARLTMDHYVQALMDQLAVPSVRRSAMYAGLATIVSVAIGLMAAILIVRSELPFRGAIDALVMLPLAVPGLVLSFGYLAISIGLKRHVSHGHLPRWLDVQEYPVVFLVLAYAARRVPYVVRSAVAGLQQTPRDLERAAANLGAGWVRVLAGITLPLIVANVIAGALLAFAFSMLEVSDSLILAQRSEYYPITKAILDLSQRLGDGMYIASALGVWAMLLLVLTILSSNSLLGKKMGSIFRI